MSTNQHARSDTVMCGALRSQVDQSRCSGERLERDSQCTQSTLFFGCHVRTCSVVGGDVPAAKMQPDI